jgi:hypothetical protein
MTLNNFVSKTHLEDRALRTFDSLIFKIRKQLNTDTNKKQSQNPEIAYLNEKLLLLVDIQEEIKNQEMEITKV